MVTGLVAGAGTAALQNGFSYFVGRDLGQLTFTFADLELSNFQSPTLDQSGFMYFAEANGSPIPFRLFYGGTEIASGITAHITLVVDNDTDLGATGDGAVTLTTPGADPTFFNEVMAKTGGSGRGCGRPVAGGAAGNSGETTTRRPESCRAGRRSAGGDPLRDWPVPGWEPGSGTPSDRLRSGPMTGLSPARRTSLRPAGR